MPQPTETVASCVLIERAQQNDAAAITSLFERYRYRLRDALRSKLGKRYRNAQLDSEDAVQDAILAALTSLHRFEYRGGGSFLAWLLRVAECEILKRIRDHQTQKRGGGQQLPVDPELDRADRRGTPSQFAQARELDDRIQACLDRMDGRERDVIVLRRYLDLTTEEIRVELGLSSAGAVRALLSRAQTRLTLMLDEDGLR